MRAAASEDRDRRGPAEAGPLARGGAPYPLVVHSHGFMAFRTSEAYLAEHLASHGYVVAAADYPLSSMAAPGGPTVADVASQPGDVRFVIDQLLALSAQPGGPLGGAIDPARVGASGLSLGGLTTLLATFHGRLRDPRIRAALPMAPAACMLTARFFASAAVPLLVMHGDSDLLLPIEQHGARAFERAQDPRYLALLRRGSHTGFAGFASFFDQQKHFARPGCAATQGKTAGGFSGLGGEEGGVSAVPPSCPPPCQATPEDPPLPAARHHDLVRAAALAFFQAHLRADGAGDEGAAARAALVERLPMESPELTVRTR